MAVDENDNEDDEEVPPLLPPLIILFINSSHQQSNSQTTSHSLPPSNTPTTSHSRSLPPMSNAQTTSHSRSLPPPSNTQMTSYYMPHPPYSQPPESSWLPPSLFETLMTPDLQLVQAELELLKQRVTRLEDKLSESNAATEISNNSGIAGLNSEQQMAITMITANPSIGWKVALRRVLMVVFGEETLAASCCKGRKNATFQPLDGTKLNAVKGI